jgi:hypothetical protein
MHYFSGMVLWIFVVTGDLRIGVLVGKGNDDE